MHNKKNVLDITRNLGEAIVESTEYRELIKAEEDFHNDVEIERILDELDALKEKNSDQEKIDELEQSLNQNTTLKNLKHAKDKYDKLFKNINNLISYMTDEESRINLVQNKSGCGGCSGGCSSGGCTKK